MIEPTDYLVTLRDILVDRFSEGELKDLYFDLGLLSYSDLPGETRRDKARELVAEFHRRRAIPKLVTAAQRMRPDLTFPPPPSNRIQAVPPPVAAGGGLFVDVPPLQTLIGREADMAASRAALGVSTPPTAVGAARVVALGGKPGVGKTALAIALAWDPQVRAHFTGGVLWGDLGTAPNLEGILSRWTTALGGDPQPARTTEARAAQAQLLLGGKPWLMILDDVWDVDHARTLLRVTGPGCAHLLTTRHPHVAQQFAHESTLRVDELSEDNAIKVLAQFAPLAVELDETGARRLARAVGNLPLLLKLVGGWLADRVTFREEAQEAFKALDDAEVWLGLSDPGRQLTAAQVIGLSVDALPAEAQRAFAMLAGFAPKPETFSLAAAREVTGADTATMGLLVRRSLLERVGDDRVTLHQALAAVAEQRARQASILREAYLAHARYYHTVVASYDESVRKSGKWYTTLVEWPNVTLALDRLARHTDDNEFALLLLTYANDWNSALSNSLADRRFAWLDAAVAAAQRVGDKRDQAIVLLTYGEVLTNQNRRDEALERYDRALALFRASSERLGEAYVLRHQGDVYAFQQQADEARARYEQALALFRAVGASSGEAYTLRVLGKLLFNLGEAEMGLAMLMEAHRLYIALGNHNMQSHVEVDLAYHAAAQGELTKAIELTRPAADYWRENDKIMADIVESQIQQWERMLSGSSEKSEKDE